MKDSNRKIRSAPFILLSKALAKGGKRCIITVYPAGHGRHTIKKGEKKPMQPQKTHKLRRDIFRSQLTLILILAVLTAAAGIGLNIGAESRRRDQNLQNVAESIAHSQLLVGGDADSVRLVDYLDSLQSALTNVDVISFVGEDNVRRFHTNHGLIGTVYDGAQPDFSGARGIYAENSVGPSGTQRRVYAPVYGPDGSYCGFVMALMLMENIRQETIHTLLIYGAITLGVVVLALGFSTQLSRRIKADLLGFEPDAFSAMYRIRNSILGALDEGILAADKNGVVQFTNDAAEKLLAAPGGAAGKTLAELGCGQLLRGAIERGEKTVGAQAGFLRGAEVVYDAAPIREGGEITGGVAILRDRTEYTQLMEDLAGTRYLVDSMRANNHEFTNKLHVILGLIQMGMYDQATSYIENISIVQREQITEIKTSIEDSSLAALLIGKIARAAEVNVKLSLRENSHFSPADLPLPSGALVTILGNLIDNALDAMNGMAADFSMQRTLDVGIYSKPGAVLLSVEDNGPGIAEEIQEKVFEKGFSTKGAGRGTGLYEVKKLTESLGGRILLESHPGEGTAFTVSFRRGEKGEEE